MKSALLSLACAVSLAGCGSLSGYDAKNSFSCKAPDGVLCSSMTGIYSNAQQNNLPAQLVHQSGAPQVAATAREGVMTQPISTGTPIRSAPRILRLWFAPWEDADGDLHDQSYVYLPVDAGRWQIEHTQRRIQEGYRPVRPPFASGSDVSGVPSAAHPQTGANATLGSLQNLADPQAAADLINAIRAKALATLPAPD